ncbi:hypothetical protein G9457_23370 (plasmid) [Aeromonas salmonicida subsp. masoucida]|nr:hypothetical protein [Aeromonas salmonicida]QYH28330.1 hypothetical protein G9H43_23090 [Aeromonas salmonicida subsp. masoucida]QYH32646.1 hypothetical protein G9457_23370 [Aeromonas salmonicida subsp. masoucida]
MPTLMGPAQAGACDSHRLPVNLHLVTADDLDSLGLLGSSQVIKGIAAG